MAQTFQWKSRPHPTALLQDSTGIPEGI